MSLSDDEICEWAETAGLGNALNPIGVQTGKVFHTKDEYCTAELLDFARAIERAATIAAMRRCAEICEKVGDEYQRQEGSLYSELRTDAESGVRSAEYEIRAEIAKLEAEK